METTFEMPGGALVIFGIYEGAAGTRSTAANSSSSGRRDARANETTWAVRPSRAGQFQDGRRLSSA